MMKSKRALGRGFTLIEVLVVVAIIALLISILLPSLSRAREQTRAAVCLAHMHQMGLGFSTYSSDSKGLFPWVPNFRYSLMSGKFYWPAAGSQGADSTFLPAGCGGIYPKYVNKQAQLFFCPSCKQLTKEFQKEQMRKLELLTRQPSGWSGNDGPHNDPGATPIGTYVYARPAAVGEHPRDAGVKMYPDSVLDPDIHLYRADPGVANWVNPNAPISQAGRMRMPMPAFVTDAYFGGFLSAHIGGYNVLYADLHGKRVNDVNNKIANEVLTSGRGWTLSGGMGGTTSKIFQVWDYFSMNP